MVVIETVGGIGIIGMVGEMAVLVVVGIGVVIGLAAEEVGLVVVEGSMAAEGEGIGIGRLGFQGPLFFSFFSFLRSIGRFCFYNYQGRR